MAKTFNPNRTGGGTFSMVRDAQGNYTLKETGFDKISSLNLPDLGAVAATTTAAKTDTAADTTGTTAAQQTAAAFQLPKQENKDDPFTTEKMLKSATDVSKGLETVSDTQKTESQLGTSRVNPFDTNDFDTGVNQFTGTGIKAPDEIFRDESNLSGYGAQTDTLRLKDPDLKVTSANVQSGKVKPPGFDFSFLKGRNFKGETEKDAMSKQTSEVAQAGIGMPTDIEKRQQRQLGMTDEERRQQYQLSSLGITADPEKTSVPFGTSVDNIQGFTDKKDFISVPAKKTFAESVKTALTGFATPTMALLKEIGKPVGSTTKEVAFNKNKFNIVTSSGAMQGRIVGNDGSYDPANNLFHGMNRTSKFGNLRKAGQKRIDRIEKTIAKKKAKGQDTSVLEKRANDFRGELNTYNKEIKQTPVTGTTAPGQSGGTENKSNNKSIVCTAMYQTTGLQDWAKAMKIWYIYQKKYLTIQHQEGYHKLFKPFVKAMHKSNIVKTIGAHFAKHRTQHLKHIMFNSKPSLLGKIYNKILEPICYWAGKK